VAPAKLARSRLHDAVVIADGDLELGSHGRVVLHPVEVGFHARGAQGRGPGQLLPFLEDALGGTPGHPAVDDGAAADAATFDVGDQRAALDHRRAAVTHQPGDALGGVGVEAGGGVVAALFDEEHVQAGLGQDRTQGCAAGAGADHHDVRVHGVRGLVVSVRQDHHSASA